MPYGCSLAHRGDAPQESCKYPGDRWLITMGALYVSGRVPITANGYFGTGGTKKITHPEAPSSIGAGASRSRCLRGAR